MSEPVFKFDGDDPAMQEANAAAQRSFKYFWRELSWERRRMIPALDLSIVKLPFSDGPRTDGRVESEQMWISGVEFDGEELAGELVNSPNWLKSVRQGDAVRAPFSNLADWMITSGGRAYGGFTVHVIRAGMDDQERKQHDQSWGLDFGDPGDVRVELFGGGKAKRGFLSGLFGGRRANPSAEAGFRDHPMCVNMLEKIEEQLQSDGDIVRTVGDGGFTLLHRDALAGNFGVVKLLVDYGADVTARTPAGRTAADLARGIGWSEIADYLEMQSES